MYICMTCCYSNKSICLLWYLISPKNCCMRSLQPSSPHPISLLHYSQITLKYIKLFIFSLRQLHSSFKKKKKLLFLQYNVWVLSWIAVFPIISFHIYLHDVLHSTSSRGAQGQCLWLIKDALWNDWQLQVDRQLQMQ